MYSLTEHDISVYSICYLKKMLVYFFTDDRILEYDVDDIVFDEKTEFQRVQIYHTKSYGNMLVLDDLQSEY